MFTVCTVGNKDILYVKRILIFKVLEVGSVQCVDLLIIPISTVKIALVHGTVILLQILFHDLKQQDLVLCVVNMYDSSLKVIHRGISLHSVQHERRKREVYSRILPLQSV